MAKQKKSTKKSPKKPTKKIVDRYTEALIKDLRAFRRKEKKGKVTAEERRNMKRREKTAVLRMIKAADELISEANSAFAKLNSIGAVTMGVQRVLDDFQGDFSIDSSLNFSEVFAKIQGAATFLNDPETVFLTAQRLKRNSDLKAEYDKLYERLKSGKWKDNEFLSNEDMKRVFSNYRRIEEEAYGLISGGGKEQYGSENLIMYMIEVRRQGGDELQAAHAILEQFEIENLPEFKDLVKLRGKKAKSISGLFGERGVYGRLGKLL